MAELLKRNMEFPAGDAQNIFGQLDVYRKIIEQELGVNISLRGEEMSISGTAEGTDRAVRLLKMLRELSEKGNKITEQDIRYALSLVRDRTNRISAKDIVEMHDEIITHTISGRPIRPKTMGQKAYADSIQNKMITFGIGPAGTGKTYLAMAMAISAFRAEEVQRIILTRPAIEAGEKLGFLPGDLQSKIDPYLRPLYDALYDIMGAEAFIRNSEKGLIEVAPLAYMRGRTLDNAFIILDEAQNTTPSQMKMFLTRIGFGSKVVVTGDRTQKDLPANERSGLDEAVSVLGKIEEIGFCELTSRDVVRHPLVQKIVEAYETYEERQSRGRGRSDSLSRSGKDEK